MRKEESLCTSSRSLLHCQGPLSVNGQEKGDLNYPSCQPPPGFASAPTGGFQRHPDIPVPPSHAAPSARPCPFPTASPRRCLAPRCSPAACPGHAAGPTVLQRLLQRFLWLRRAGVAWPGPKEGCWQHPTPSSAGPNNIPATSGPGLRRDPSGGPRAVIGCSASLWNLPGKASQSGRTFHAV